jgi:hypothetical protein
MNAAPPKPRLILTTETPSGIRQRILALVFCGTLAAAVTSLIYLARETPIDDEAIRACALLQALMLGLAIFITLLTPRGSWVLDDAGVAYRPCHRRGRTLRWSSVDRLNWRGDAATLAGGDVKIVIPWALFPQSQRLAARAFAEVKLACAFDLKDVPRPVRRLFGPEASITASLAHFLMLIALGAALSIPWMILVLVAFWLPFPTWHWFGRLVGGLTAIYPGGLTLYALILARRELRPLRQIHPEWPWRLRRPSAVKSAKFGVAADPWLTEY